MKLNIELGEAQVAAAKLLGITMSKDVQSLVDTAIMNTLRARISTSADSASADALLAYDKYAHDGVVFPCARGEFAAMQTQKFEDAFVALGGKRRERTVKDTESK